MLKRHNIKSKTSRISSSGKISCLLLLLLTFLLINPATTSASALEAEEVTNNSEPTTQADTDASRIEISFTPTEVSGEMTPTTEAGLKKQLEATATIAIQNAEDYTIYIGAKTTGLVGVNNGEVVESIKSATSYEDLVANSWGIYYGEGTSVPTNATYLPVEASRGTQIEAGGRTTSALTKTYALGFAANINNQMPADTYENEITLSVVSSPLEITGLTTLTEMQQMTSAVCEVSEIGDEIQLKDVRDNKYYWVAKLADGKCWMTQNLDLDLSTSKTLTTTDSDVPEAGYKPTYSTATTASSSTILADNTGQRSWSLGDYRITNPNTSSDCGSKKSSAANCPSQFTTYRTPTSQNEEEEAHYILGNHYQWNTATAGTGGSITSGQAPNSICPKGWRLPTSNTGGEFTTLVNELGGTSTTDNITKAPFYGVRGGYVDQNTTYLFSYAGYEGVYWSSTPNSNSTQANLLDFHSTLPVNPSNLTNRYQGFSVRCIAR